MQSSSSIPILKRPRTRELERRSSAYTLSDMEVFVFPELLYALLLATLMSPALWRWRDDPWFAGIERLRPYRRILRLKQYVIDHFTFNLDLDTWGLTTKAREMQRFGAFIDADALRQSNALFGYEGDRYYFDLDIRAHFGLDQYDGEVIPYWKTETVEAMEAFRHKPGYPTGAGECVSLAALYAASLFLVARVPLSALYLMATPLHSQNFIDVDDGILTNNRRLVTKAMWFNGTVLSAQARRALENERVTIVAHESGHIHTLFPEASLAPAAYERFTQRLTAFLRTSLTPEVLGNFLRHRRDLQACFQLRWPVRGVDHYIGLDRVFAYEESGRARLTDATRPALVAEVEWEEFRPEKHPHALVLNDLEAYLKAHPVDFEKPDDVAAFRRRFASECLDVKAAMEHLIRFCRVQPRLPDMRQKTPVSNAEPLGLTTDMDREAVIRRLEQVRARLPVADLAFYAGRDLSRTEPDPFLLAALERSPVSLRATHGWSEEQMVEHLRALPEDSIYEGPGRLAQPDEVWNFGRGDGVEKAVLLANLLHARRPDTALSLEIQPEAARLTADRQTWAFPSAKRLPAQVWPLT